MGRESPLDSKMCVDGRIDPKASVGQQTRRATSRQTRTIVIAREQCGDPQLPLRTGGPGKRMRRSLPDRSRYWAAKSANSTPARATAPWRGSAPRRASRQHRAPRSGSVDHPGNAAMSGEIVQWGPARPRRQSLECSTIRPEPWATLIYPAHHHSCVPPCRDRAQYKADQASRSPPATTQRRPEIASRSPAQSALPDICVSTASNVEAPSR